MSRTPTTDTPAPIDQYRTLPNALKRPLLRFTASQPFPPDRPTTAQTLLDLSSTSYTARLASRNVLLEDPVPTGAEKVAQEVRDDALRRGRKRPAGTGAGVDSSLTGGKGKRQRRRGKVGLMGREEASGCGIWQVGKGIPIKYNLLLPLHYMYLSYLSEMLPLPAYPAIEGKRHLPPGGDRGLLPSGKLPNGLGCEQISSRIIKADFTGAVVRVKKSKNPALVGIQGIVVQETAETFRLVTHANVVKVIPKSNALFTITFPAYAFPTLPGAPGRLADPSAATFDADTFARALAEVPKIEVDVLGAAFTFRAEDRAGRKFKYGAGGAGWGEEWVGLEGVE